MGQSSTGNLYCSNDCAAKAIKIKNSISEEIQQQIRDNRTKGISVSQTAINAGVSTWTVRKYSR